MGGPQQGTQIRMHQDEYDGLPSCVKRGTVLGDGWVDAEVIDVTQLASNEPIKWELIARELRLP
jgi:hypothetical protein